MHESISTCLIIFFPRDLEFKGPRSTFRPILSTRFLFQRRLSSKAVVKSGAKNARQLNNVSIRFVGVENFRLVDSQERSGATRIPKRRSCKKRKCTSAAVAGTEITGGSIAFYPTYPCCGRNPCASHPLPFFRFPPSLSVPTSSRAIRSNNVSSRA